MSGAPDLFARALPEAPPVTEADAFLAYWKALNAARTCAGYPAATYVDVRWAYGHGWTFAQAVEDAGRR